MYLYGKCPSTGTVLPCWWFMVEFWPKWICKMIKWEFTVSNSKVQTLSFKAVPGTRYKLYWFILYTGYMYVCERSCICVTRIACIAVCMRTFMEPIFLSISFFRSKTRPHTEGKQYKYRFSRLIVVRSLPPSLPSPLLLAFFRKSFACLSPPQLPHRLLPPRPRLPQGSAPICQFNNPSIRKKKLVSQLRFGSAKERKVNHVIFQANIMVRWMGN